MTQVKPADENAAPFKRPEVSRLALSADITQVARLTLMSAAGGAGFAKLAVMQTHRADPDTDEIAYATRTDCRYGWRFLLLHRTTQAFAVAHETGHHALGHIPTGALLAKREGRAFNFDAFNIAADAQLNFVLSHVAKPPRDKFTDAVVSGITASPPLKFVEWHSIVNEAKLLAKTTGLTIDKRFLAPIESLTSVDIYEAIMHAANQARTAAKRSINNPDKPAASDAGGGQHDGQSTEPKLPGDTPPSSEDQPVNAKPDATDDVDAGDNWIRNLANNINADNDIVQAIREAMTQGEAALRDQIAEARVRFEAVRRGIETSDALMKVCDPGPTTTNWETLLRRYGLSALLTSPSNDPTKPSRRTVSAIVNHVAGHGTGNIVMEPRTRMRSPAKRLIIIEDTSGSVFYDAELLARFKAETMTLVRRTGSSCVRICADEDVTDELEIADNHRKLQDNASKGGRGTDFRPALERAAAYRPDLVIYLTDLCGTFPANAPPFPLIWAYPAQWETIETPFGRRIALN